MIWVKRLNLVKKFMVFLKYNLQNFEISKNCKNLHFGNFLNYNSKLILIESLRKFIYKA